MTENFIFEQLRCKISFMFCDTLGAAGLMGPLHFHEFLRIGTELSALLRYRLRNVCTAANFPSENKVVSHLVFLRG